MYQFFFSSFCILNLVIQIKTQDVTVDTKAGTFVGIKSNINIANTTYKVAKFLGIPYAEPPVGKLRFKIPVPKMKHTGSMIVQQTSLRCLEMFPMVQQPQSEDCLYLNVVVPDKNETEKLAVMVWIHGGNFIRGSANGYNLDGLAGYGNVIVVSINYRLNAWGFLSTEDSNAPGNYGLWDQRLAIKWVKDNIAYFGGDTSRITVFGESAGAASAIYQGLYPGNKGLFQRMIAQSGSAAATWSYNLRPKKTTEDLAKHIGCYNESAPIMVNCLRNLNASVIHQAINGANNAPFFTFYPSVDSVFISCNPRDLLNLDKTSASSLPARDTFASFDLLSGMNAGEGAMAYNPMYGYIDPETFLPNSSYFKNILIKTFVYTGFQGQINASNINAVTDALYDRYTDSNTITDPYTLRDKTADVFSDGLFLGPLKTTLQTHTQLSTKSTYMYYLSVVPSNHLLPTPSWFKRANHADDILYLFINAFSPYMFDEQEFHLSKLIVNSWTNFAKTGNPNSPRDQGLAWRQYTQSNPAYLDLKRGTTSADVKEGLLKDRADYWLNDMPQVIGYVPEPCKFIQDTSGAKQTFNLRYLLFALFVLHVAIML